MSCRRRQESRLGQQRPHRLPLPPVRPADLAELLPWTVPPEPRQPSAQPEPPVPAPEPPYPPQPSASPGRGNLIRPSGGIGAFRRQRHARQQQLPDHKRTRAGASYFGTHTTPGTVNQRAGGLTLSLLVKVAYVHNGLLGRRDMPPQRCLPPLWWSCTTKMCQMTPYA